MPLAKHPQYSTQLGILGGQQARQFVAQRCFLKRGLERIAIHQPQQQARLALGQLGDKRATGKNTRQLPAEGVSGSQRRQPTGLLGFSSLQNALPGGLGSRHQGVWQRLGRRLMWG